MARIDSKQLNQKFTGSFTLSGSFLGDSNTSASFGRIVGTTFVGDGSQLTGITSVTTSSIQNLKAGIVSGSSQIISISDMAQIGSEIFEIVSWIILI